MTEIREEGDISPGVGAGQSISMNDNQDADKSEEVQGKEDSSCCSFWKWSILIIYYMFIGLHIIYSYIIYIYNMVFCSCSFSLSFYGINFLCPASGNFLYLVSKGRSTGCARNENSVSISFQIIKQRPRVLPPGLC